MHDLLILEMQKKSWNFKLYLHLMPRQSDHACMCQPSFFACFVNIRVTKIYSDASRVCKFYATLWHIINEFKKIKIQLEFLSTFKYIFVSKNTPSKLEGPNVSNFHYGLIFFNLIFTREWCIREKTSSGGASP